MALLKQYTLDGGHLSGSGYVEFHKAIQPYIDSEVSQTH
jgi:lysophospholipase L1-like esterase